METKQITDPTILTLESVVRRISGKRKEYRTAAENKTLKRLHFILASKLAK